ncbi:hypothetical protein [Alistipes sp.]|uniref:hypothetical protein n=1 Tax=Alistipes sp. TaxID=1872444 RepID=UPI0023F1BC21|nr:hypothetical protein [Alistipes sp.]
MVYKDVILHLEDKFHLDDAVTGLGWVNNKDWLKNDLIELFNHDGLIGFDIPDKIEKYKDGLYVSRDNADIDVLNFTLVYRHKEIYSFEYRCC